MPCSKHSRPVCVLVGRPCGVFRFFVRTVSALWLAQHNQMRVYLRSRNAAEVNSTLKQLAGFGVRRPVFAAPARHKLSDTRRVLWRFVEHCRKERGDFFDCNSPVGPNNFVGALDVVDVDGGVRSWYSSVTSRYGPVLENIAPLHRPEITFTPYTFLPYDFTSGRRGSKLKTCPTEFDFSLFILWVNCSNGVIYFHFFLSVFFFFFEKIHLEKNIWPTLWFARVHVHAKR